MGTVKPGCFVLLLVLFPCSSFASIPSSPDCIWEEISKKNYDFYRNDTTKKQFTCPNGYFVLTDEDFVPVESFGTWKSSVSTGLHVNDKFARDFKHSRKYLCCPGEASRVKG